MGYSEDGWIGTTKVNKDPVITVSTFPYKSVIAIYRGYQSRKKVDQMAELKRMTGHKEARYFGTFDLSEKGKGRSGTFGIGILSNLEVLQSKTHLYKLLPGRQGRGALAVQVRLGEAKVWCVCTHLQNDTTGLEQESQAGELIEFCRGLDGPIVVGGDLNSLPQFAAVRMLRQHFHGDEGIPKRRTFPLFNDFAGLGITLDYMFVRGLEILGLVVVENEYASDHLPCVLEVKV